LSDDGGNGLTVIAFIGSVFSPYYRRARERSRGEPHDHCAINVALFGRHSRWSMTERGARDTRATPAGLAIGPSAMRWDGRSLIVDIDERTVPIPSRIRGTVRLTPHAVLDAPYPLDREGLHRWQPIAPRARVSVDLEHPRLVWSGTGYLDANDGDGPLEASFASWHWSRASVGDATAILYDVHPRDGPPSCLALHCDAGGHARLFEAPPPVVLPRSRWGIARTARSDDPQSRVLRTLVDAPFYARSLVAQQVTGWRTTAVHESLSLDRFNAAWVRALLPFRMPRRATQSHG